MKTYWVSIKVAGTLRGVAEVISYDKDNGEFWVRFYDYEWLLRSDEVDEVFYGTQTEALNHFEARFNYLWG